MLSYIQGTLTYRSPTLVVIETNGLGYAVQISLNTFSKIGQQSSCKLHTYLHVGGSLQGPVTLQLFGFYDEAERDMFLLLLGVSGVGAATVRMILSSMTADEVRHAIVTENVRLLESIKGIGPKTAKRIILELKDKAGKLNTAETTAPSPAGNQREEALSALMMLGFSRVQAEHAIHRVEGSRNEWTTEELIKQALKAM